MFNRIANDINKPNWKEYILDGEETVINVVLELYPSTKFANCLFHVNKAIIRKMATKQLTKYIKNCKTDIQLWTYEQFRRIFFIPFLPKESMKNSFVKIEEKLVNILGKNLDPFDFDNMKSQISYMKRTYYCNESKIELICKYKKYLRTTNLIEGAHNGLAKGSLLSRKSNMNTMIQGTLTFI